MEAHHYPQLHHQPKPWKEYLLEGFSDAIEGITKKITRWIKDRRTKSLKTSYVLRHITG